MAEKRKKFKKQKWISKIKKVFEKKIKFSPFYTFFL